MDKQEFKAAMKQWKKGKRKAMRPFKFLSVLTGILAVVLVIATAVMTLFDNTIALFFQGDSFWKLENADASAVYYEADFEDEATKNEYGNVLVQEVEGEGASLLYNENDALPLAKGAKVTLMSNSSVDLVYGGTGSGNVDASEADTLKVAMEKAGFEVNETMWDFYLQDDISEYARGGASTVSTSSFSVSELPWELYTDDVLDSIESYGDAVIVTISRIGGEGSDLDFEHGDCDVNYLALGDDEKVLLENLKSMKADGRISKIVMLVNSSNPLQMDFMKDNDYDIDSILWIGGVGISGIDAVAQILCGDYNPSGGLVDTYCYDNYSSPAMANNEPVTYAGDTSAIPDSADTYEIYQEGIYVGYKYYETRYEDYVMGTGNAGDYAYGDIVAYPFGYGLSYTDFEFSDMSLTIDTDNNYNVEVTVTNVGDVSGKQTVEVYVQTPYTEYDQANYVEKASVQLAGFAKTEILTPGSSQTVTIQVDPADFASYDSYGAGTYILDEGTYYFTAAKDAHEAVNNILAAKGYTPDNTDGKMDGEGDASLVASPVILELDTETCSISKAGVKIENQLAESDINTYSGRGDNSVTYLSRSDWMGTWPSETTQLTLTDQMIDDLQLVRYDASDYEAIDMPTLGADNGLSLYDMMGLDYDDPAWDDLLDQLTFDEMVTLIGDSFHWTHAVESVNAPGSRDENGPQGLTATLFGAGLGVKTTAFTSEDVMAATWNTELMSRVGNLIGNDCVMANVAILYGPGNNIHRTPYGGRNFEYYSEDGFLSGKISAAEVGAIEEKGVHVVAKHFALNDSEQDRIGLGVWLTEQAAREIYLKAFQDIFEEGNAGGTMVAYTRWGCVWSGGCEGLMTGILRNEWGSNGLTITDNVLTQYVNGPDALMAGGVTTFDAMLWYVTSALPDYENDPIMVAAMKEACHHDLYAIIYSVAMNGVGEGTTVKAITPSKIALVRNIMVVMIILFVLFTVLAVIRKRKYKKENPKPKKA